MQSKNKTRIKNLEEHKQGMRDELLAVKLINGDEVTIKHDSKKYSEEEFKKLYPHATFINVTFMK